MDGPLSGNLRKPAGNLRSMFPAGFWIFLLIEKFRNLPETSEAGFRIIHHWRTTRYVILWHKQPKSYEKFPIIDEQTKGQLINILIWLFGVIALIKKLTK